MTNKIRPPLCGAKAWKFRGGKKKGGGGEETELGGGGVGGPGKPEISRPAAGFCKLPPPPQRRFPSGFVELWEARTPRVRGCQAWLDNRLTRIRLPARKSLWGGKFTCPNGGWGQGFSTCAARGICDKFWCWEVIGEARNRKRK